MTAQKSACTRYTVFISALSSFLDGERSFGFSENSRFIPTTIDLVMRRNLQINLKTFYGVFDETIPIYLKKLFMVFSIEQFKSIF